jgi:phospholipase C
MQTVRHLVVLMLENRSFDHVLGFYVPAAGGQKIAGLTGREFNCFDPFGDGSGSARVYVNQTAGTVGTTTVPDPHHEHDDAMVHLFCVPAPPPGTIPNNGGFLYNYARQKDAGMTTSPEKAPQIMGCFDTAAQLPAIQALAENFTVLDHWFSSLPGPTWPNRFFAHCATSGGLSGSPSDLSSAISVEAFSSFAMPTIYENLSAAARDWRVYYHDVPQALALQRLHARRDNFQHIQRFFDDAAAGSLPAYSFVEPAFFNSTLLGLIANDMHPSHDVRFGDQLVASVYNALRAGPSWSDTALLVVWDEHGGFYDHVPPPSTVSPDGKSDASGFDFKQLGVRVPAILASPRTGKGAVDSTVFDHSSIPATVRAIFGTGSFLTARDAQTATFERLLGGPLRQDTPSSIQGATNAPRPDSTSRSALSPMQEHLLQLADALPDALAHEETSRAVAAPDETVEASIGRVRRYLGQ